MTDPWKVIEENFHPDRNRVSESVFSLANERMGVRGYMEEGASCDSLQGAYYNGVYEWARDENKSGYKGIVSRSHYMVNGANWVGVRIKLNGTAPDPASPKVSNFSRILDMRNGVYTRTYTCDCAGVPVMLTFIRFLDMRSAAGYQRIILESPGPVEAELTFTTDFNGQHWGLPSRWTSESKKAFDGGAVITAKTQSTGQRLSAAMAVENSLGNPFAYADGTNEVSLSCSFTLNGKAVFTRYACIEEDRKGEDLSLEAHAVSGAAGMRHNGYDSAFDQACKYWEKFWAHSDIEICGDEENQQGIRFCIFQLHQTYRGADPHDNIGAKGLTGEAYSGHAFWDTETYCLPYYLFSDTDAAKDLLLFRYYTLPQARERAKMLDCSGACYPIATLNGHEACDLWQHASLQFQPSTGVAYGIWHYVILTGDEKFLHDYGCEMLLAVSHFLMDRGQWNHDRTKFGYYCVMGPDEFQMMVNHNCYTNYMAKRTLEYTLEVLGKINSEDPALCGRLLAGEGFARKDLEYMALCAEKMYIPYNDSAKLFEQHEGYFDLPHVDVNSIPVTDFPLYSHWSYDRIYRNDMIKQPDVLMFMLLYNGSFTREQKLANYEFYEPRCIHESSLSPSVHSILAAELGKTDEAVNFFSFATRMDLDDYNRNACEGLHTTSIAAAWMNVVYGFGGLRSDGETLSLSPLIPDMWKSYSFKITYHGVILKVSVTHSGTEIESEAGEADLILDGERITVGG
ncbi:MAG: family 65 glycosyl hydrolase [Clostridia bacterium]|nr:family 65 glycosyl hydrolase [Clostridia bacterium]